MAGQRQRPEAHDQDKSTPGAQDVCQLAATHIQEGVRQQEQRLQKRKLFIGEGNVFFDGFDGNRQCLAVQITDGDGGTD